MKAFHELDFMQDLPLPSRPTAALPGSPRKIVRLATRLREGRAFWHPRDVLDDLGRGLAMVQSSNRRYGIVTGTVRQQGGRRMRSGPKTGREIRAILAHEQNGIRAERQRLGLGEFGRPIIHLASGVDLVGNTHALSGPGTRTLRRWLEGADVCFVFGGGPAGQTFAYVVTTAATYFRIVQGEQA